MSQHHHATDDRKSLSTRPRLFGRLVVLFLVAVWASYFWGRARDGERPAGEFETAPGEIVTDEIATDEIATDEIATDEGTVNAGGLQDDEARALFVVRTADLSLPEVLIESFEWRRKQVFTWGGGNLARKHATDGEQSYQVTFDIRNRDFKCRPNAIQPDFSLHRKVLVDTFCPDGPFYIGLRLVALDGETRYSFPPTQVPSGTSTLEFDLRLPELRGFDLTQIGEIRFTREVTTSRVTAFFDNIRLAREGVATYEFFDEPPSVTSASTPNYVPDSEFSQGLRLWRARRLPGSHWRVSFVRGENAWEGGPSLALHARNKGGVELISPELDIPPGRYRASYRVRGHGTTSCMVELREEVPGNWRILASKEEPRRPVSHEWQEFEESFHVLPAAGTAPGDVGSRTMSLVLTVSGSGNCVIDTVRLESLAGVVPDPVAVTLYEVPPTLYETGEPVAWNDIRRSFPVFYDENALLVSESTRVFRTFCRSIGLRAAVDVGDALHSGMSGTVLETIERRRSDASVGMWLLTGAADWILSHVSTSLIRGLGDHIAEIDPRLVAVGLDSADMSGQFRHIDAVGALVVGNSSGVLDQDTLDDFETALQNASTVVQAAGGSFLARARVTDRSLRQKSFLARIHGASGLVLEPPSNSMVKDRVWRVTKEVVQETAEMTERLKGAHELTVKTSHETVRVRGYRLGDRAILVVVSLWPQGLNDVSFETELGNHTLNLAAWETTTVELGEEK